jgi:hypothetical protein
MSELLHFIERSLPGDEDTIIDRWSNVFDFDGFNGGMEPELKRTLAFKMEEVARYMVSLPHHQSGYGQNYVEKLVDVCIFPIIYRVIKHYNQTIPDIIHFYEEVTHFYTVNESLIREHHGMNGIDMEAELTAQFSEEYKDKTDGIEPIKRNYKHKF